MVNKVLKTLGKLNVPRGCRVLVALSGGVDSSVLLDVLLRLREELSISVSAAHLNHMLRGAEADADEAFVTEKCRRCGVELYSERVDVAALSEKTGESVELCARGARYDFLRRAKNALGADIIATAHNANDNLETILLNLTRGSGLRGLCGIPHVREDIIRPLIECTREEIEDYAGTFEVSFCVDKTNSETEFSRNKIRHLVIPALESINPSVVENATRLSEVLREDAAFVDEQVLLYETELSESEASCERSLLLKSRSLTKRLAEKLAAYALKAERYTLEYKHIAMILDLAKSENPSGKISLPGGIEIRRQYEKIIFLKQRDEAVLPELIITSGDHFWGDYEISVKKCDDRPKINNLEKTFFVPCGIIQGNLYVRPRKEGDEIKLPKRRTKTIKKLFIDEKLPKNERERVPVIADDEKVFAVFGFGYDERFSQESEDGYFIKINKK